jgi:superfamily II DNA or RNA helicase
MEIPLFTSLFHARQDVYAIRWEKDGKSGYMPACKLDWEDYRKFKASGGLYKDYTKKEIWPLNEEAIRRHLSGRETIGIYPLLEDNTSFFIAADFDEANWQDTIQRLYKACMDVEIPAYMERSRSGNGGHLWIFFEENLPAEQTRKVLFELLKKSGIISPFEKEPSFDRLFPNQDIHSANGKSFGNLIALPLNGKSLQNGHSAFLDPETFEPYLDQWEALSRFQKLSTIHFLNLYERFFSRKAKEVLKSSTTEKSLPAQEMEIVISNQVYLKRLQLNSTLIAFLRDNLNILNSDYLTRKNIGKSTFNIDKYFRLIEETPDGVLLPRGFVASLVGFCKQEHIPFKIVDNRKKPDPVVFESEIELLPHQELALEKVADKDFGVIVSPPGSGKTIIGLEIIAEKGLPALIVVHRQQLFDQWMERIQSFLKIPKSEIGQIGNQKCKVGKKITVAMIQSIARMEDIEKISNSFGTIIVDECHHIPAKSFREAIIRFHSYYLYGLTATPKRKNNDEKLIYVYIGNVLYQADPATSFLQKPDSSFEIHIRETNLFAPFDYKVDQYETISRILIHDTQRNALIVEDIEKHAGRFKTILVLTERKAHVDILNLYLKDKFETITLHGENSERSRKIKLEQLKQGHYKIVLSTGQFFGEGMDVDTLECLFIIYPFAFEGKLVQYIGRIQRSGKAPVIFDYRDSRIDYFEKMFKMRNRYYKRLRR